MFCAECGKTIPESVKFCPACGTPVVANEAAAPPPPPPPVPPAPPIPPASAAYGGPLAYGAPPAYGPPPMPPRRRHPGLIPGIVTAVIVVAAALGVGLYVGLKSDDSGTSAVTTAVTVAATIPTAPPTTAPQSVTTESPATTSSLVTTSSEQTTTTEDAAAILTERAASWMDLLESIPGSGQDKTAAIEAFLTPKDKAQERAAQYQTDWSTPANPQDIIKTDSWDQIVNVLLDPDGARAVTIDTLKLVCRDGLTTRGLEALSWRLEGGEWLRTVEHEPLTSVDGPLVPFGRAIRVGTFLWSPETIHELKHLGVGEGPTAAGMFMSVEFFIKNEGQKAAIPGDYKVTAVDGTGKEYALSPKGEDWWSGDVDDRFVDFNAGESSYLWYTFDIPAGLDLQSVQFRIVLPTV